jgi:uncharacterized protein YndB with AHSA1/START domain
MIRVDSSVVIRRPVADVFTFVADTRNDPQWHLDATDVVKTSVADIGPGTTFTVGIRFMGRREARWRVTEFEPDRREVIRVAAEPFNPTLTYLCEPADGSTRFTRRIEIEPRGYVRVLAPLVKKMIERRQTAFVQRLKDVLERPAELP